MLLDGSVAIVMLHGARTDGTMILLGAAATLFTALLPRLSSYALSYALHTVTGVFALSLMGAEAGPEVGQAPPS